MDEYLRDPAKDIRDEVGGDEYADEAYAHPEEFQKRGGPAGTELLLGPVIASHKIQIRSGLEHHVEPDNNDDNTKRDAKEWRHIDAIMPQKQKRGQTPVLVGGEGFEPPTFSM